MSKHAETPRGDAAPPPAQAGGRMAAEDRRRQIVLVAMRLFSERGFRGTTTKEIARDAGVSEAIIFRHFATKDELYAAIIDHKSCEGAVAGVRCSVAETIKGGLSAAVERKDDRGVFEGLALGMMEHHQHDPDFLRILMYAALEGHALTQMFWDRNVRVMYEFLGSYIRERQRDGAFRDVNPLVVVRAFTGSIIHHSLNNILWDKDPARRILNIPNKEAAREFTEILLRGIAADSRKATARQPKRAEAQRRAPSASSPAGKPTKKK